MRRGVTWPPRRNDLADPDDKNVPLEFVTLLEFLFVPRVPDDKDVSFELTDLATFSEFVSLPLEDLSFDMTDFAILLLGWLMVTAKPESSQIIGLERIVGVRARLCLTTQHPTKKQHPNEGRD